MKKKILKFQIRKKTYIYIIILLFKKNIIINNKILITKIIIKLKIIKSISN